MAKVLNFKEGLIGNFGYPVWENPTGAMVEAAFAYHRMKFRYITTEVTPENLKAAFQGVKAMGYKGFNCTIPHKVAIIQYLDGLGESATLIQAVNCVVERDGEFFGENTDGKGFLESLKTVANPDGKNVVIFGAGGAARAVAVELVFAGVKSITIVNRSEKRGRELLDLLNRVTAVDAAFALWKGDYSIPGGTHIVINCTSIGLSPNVSERLPVENNSLQKSMVVCDLVPNPPKTIFLQEAVLRGCKTRDGLGMLVNQGRIGIKYWTGADVNIRVMRKCLEELFNG